MLVEVHHTNAAQGNTGRRRHARQATIEARCFGETGSRTQKSDTVRAYLWRPRRAFPAWLIWRTSWGSGIQADIGTDGANPGGVWA